MCCDRWSERALNLATTLQSDNPDRKELLELSMDIVNNCSETKRTHTARILASLSPQTDPDAIPEFLQKNPKKKILLEKHSDRVTNPVPVTS